MSERFVVLACMELCFSNALGFCLRSRASSHCCWWDFGWKRNARCGTIFWKLQTWTMRIPAVLWGVTSFEKDFWVTAQKILKPQWGMYKHKALKDWGIKYGENILCFLWKCGQIRWKFHTKEAILIDFSSYFSYFTDGSGPLKMAKRGREWELFARVSKRKRWQN